MAQIKPLIHSFNYGEVSAAALARIDHEKLRLAAEIQENLFPHVVGKGQVRPGTEYLGTTASNNTARFIPFVKSPTQTALIECTNTLTRFWVNDALVTRAAVTSTVGNGDFSAATAWTLSATSGAAATISGGVLTLAAAARGSSTLCKQSVTTSSANTEHALRIVVTQGTVLFRCGSTDGGDEYISETSLGEGEHSLAFTPTASPYYIRFFTRTDLIAVIESCTVESAGVVSLTAPWSASDLPLIRYDQSLDVLFLACASWQQRRIERRKSGRSWSIVKYQPDDGPFVTGNTNRVRLTAGAQYGATTITASAAVFSSSHVGALVRLVPDGQSYTVVLAGEDTYTPTIRVSGIGTANDHTFAITGTWVGTITQQLNYDDGLTGFVDSATTHTANASGTVTFGTDHDNVIFYVRYGFKAAAYTSGSATVAITNTGGGSAGIYRITAFNSATSVNVQTLSPPSSLSSTDNWQLGAWSDANGWPSAVGFYDGRLWWGGEDKFWGSESDNYYAFNLTQVGAAGSIQRAVATGGNSHSIRWIMPLQRLLLGTSGAETSIRSSSFDEPLTPTNITLKDASTQGVASLSPVKMDNRAIYIHRDSLKSMELVYDFEANDYRAGSLMLLNDTIAGAGFTGVSVQRSPENYVWHIRSAGDCAVLLYNPKEKAQGWFKFIAGASAAGAATIEDVVVLPSTSQDRVYLLVKRTINGSTVRYLEKLAKHSEAQGGTSNRMADSFVYTAGPITTVTGLTHLIGETVIAWGTRNGVTGPIGTTYTVNGSGQITLPGSSTDVVVGLAYTWRYKTAKLAYGGGENASTALLSPKRVTQLGLLLENTLPDAVEYGSNFTTMFNLPRVEGGTDITSTSLYSTYDEQTFAFGGTWDTDARLCLKGSAPYPATLLGLVVGVET